LQQQYSQQQKTPHPTENIKAEKTELPSLKIMQPKNQQRVALKDYPPQYLDNINGWLIWVYNTAF